MNDIQLTRIIRAAEAHAERESDGATPRKMTTLPLSKDLAQPIVRYLLDPYAHGFWELRANWNPSSPFARHLIGALGTIEEIEGKAEFVGVAPSTVAKKISEERRSELLRVSNRLSAINSLFRASIKKSEGTPVTRFNEVDSWIEKIDLDELSTKFPEAWKTFSEKIYFDGFVSGISTSKPYRIKSGLIALIEPPRAAGTLHAVAMGREELVALCEFYSGLGSILEPSLRRVFAPDEDLFRPYFPLVSGVLSHVVPDGQISRVFEQALAYYEKEDYQHCISSLGLISEDFLQRIYTTLLREALPGGLTLGQIVERIHKRVEDLFPQQKVMQKSPDSLYEQINAIESITDADQLKPVLRNLIGLLLDDRQYFNRRIDNVMKPHSRKSVFPSAIADRINEMLKWRNAASHNSRIPLGAHEADRTLFCLIGVISWWQDKLNQLDWSQERNALIEKLLQEAKSR